jgi:hypothetical protein
VLSGEVMLGLAGVDLVYLRTDGAALRGRPRRVHAEGVMSVYLYAVLGGRPRSACGSGICAEPLRLVEVGDLVALVGDVPATPEVTAMTLRAQDAVLRRLAAEVDAVLPARFGTLLRRRRGARRRAGAPARAAGRGARPRGRLRADDRARLGDSAAPAPAAGGDPGGGPARAI